MLTWTNVSMYSKLRYKLARACVMLTTTKTWRTKYFCKSICTAAMLRLTVLALLMDEEVERHPVLRTDDVQDNRNSRQHVPITVRHVSLQKHPERFDIDSATSDDRRILLVELEDASELFAVGGDET